ncbi:MAG: serine protease [Treponema sp.]|nr:serine protease [Treponema sp.]
MPQRFFLFVLLLLIIFPVTIFAQQGASSVRDYVGLINQTYHPNIVSYFEKAKEEFTKRGENDVVKMLDIILSGGFGSGFLYSDANGNFYVLTNNHVISQAHTISITFERLDGTKKKIDNLRIIAADEETDLAILAFPPGESPLVNRGLTLLDRVIEGEEVFSAGFPGLGITPIWQFGNGRVSNAFARFPKSLDDETLMGPYIQHTAQIDDGNSGGPLLVAQQNAPSGYAVIGINTLSGIRRQAANYAIPVNRIQPFINNALNPKPETYKAALDDRLLHFIDGFNTNTAIYPHIAEFLSAICIGENAEYAFEEMLDKGSRTVVRTFIDKAREDFIGAMGIAIAWTIENSVRSGTGVIRASIKEVTGSDEEYTVIFTINNKDVSSVWIREYGNWRIKTFGTVAAGDQSLIRRRQNQREAAANLRINSDIHIEAGYATLFDKSPAAFYASFEYNNFFGANFYYAGSDYLSIGLFYGLRFGIPAGNFGIMPYFRAGVAYSHDSGWLESSDFGLPISLFGQAGIKVTSTYVPGLYAGAGFQYNFLNFSSHSMKMGLSFSAGYAF